MKLLTIAFVLTSGLLFGTTSFARHGIFPTKTRIVPYKIGDKVQVNNLQYYGGPVLSHVHVVTVFWGNSVDSDLQQRIGGLYNAIVNSNEMDWLNQYNTMGNSIDDRQGTNQNIGQGSYGGEVLIQPKNTSTDLQDKDIQDELEYQIANNVLPKPDQNTLYMIHFPSTISMTVDGAKSCSDFCAYHEGFTSKAFGNVFYGVMPDFKTGACSFACNFTSDAFESTTAISSHELAEAITDPFPTPGDKPAYPQAWNTVAGAEIADLCPSATTLQTSTLIYKITRIWDNKTQACYRGTFQSSL